LWLNTFLDQTGLSVDGVNICAVDVGERQKNLDTCRHIWSLMLAAGLDRRALVINLGGGVVGDMGGFCAATFNRGVDFVQVPTTLLAMTDAAVGGKLGVDFRGVKNLIGVFQQPVRIFIDEQFLTTLPERELRSGMAEVIKHALIGEPGLWDIICAGGVGSEDWKSLVNRSVQVKMNIVKEDPRESGLRALLNFGHTIGHALESYFLNSEEPLTHGEAVAVGMFCEAVLAPASFGLPLGELQQVLSRYFLHRPIPSDAIPVLWGFMQHDKKNSGGVVRVILPDREPYRMHSIAINQSDVERAISVYNNLRC
jgi:3-dehydroquinate synthase